MVHQLVIILLAMLLAMGSSDVLAQTRKNGTIPLKAGAVVKNESLRQNGVDCYFYAEPLSDEVFARMQGKSYPKGCTIPRSALRYLRVLHYDGDGERRVGELVCNQAIANSLLVIFRQLYEQRYPIERMVLIDEYGADDERSMRANNTTCFCYRTVAKSTKLSKHAQGLAIDINPLYNPYYRKLADGTERIQPANARPYLNRKSTFPYKIVPADPCYRLFLQHGFRWGGSWRTMKDYQHFEK